MIVAALLVVVVVLYRVILGMVGMEQAQWLHNFSPLAAIALCGAIYFPKRIALAAPLLALLVSDLILNARYGVSLFHAMMIPQYLALGLISAFGLMLRGRPQPAAVLLTSIGGSAFFFVITNTAAWFSDPFYAKTAAGWMQALTVGHPEFHPTTLEFFRNTLVSDVLFTAVFLGCMALARRPSVAHATVRQEELAPW